MKSVSKNVFLNLIYRIVNLVAPLITSPYLSRTLGANAIGIHAYINSIAYYFFSIAMLGVNVYGCREVARTQNNKCKLSNVFWQIFYLQAFLSIVLSIVYLIFAFFLAKTYGIVPYIMVIYVLSAATDIDWFAFGLEQFKVTTFVRSTTKILTIILILLLVKSERDLWLYVLIMQLCNLLNFVFIWPIVFKRTSFQKPRKRDIISHIKPNLILFFPGIASSAYLYIDKIMIGYFHTNSEVGFYNYAENIYGILCSINVASSSVFLAHASKELSVDGDNVDSVYNISKYISIINIAIMFGTLAVADLFIPWFLGNYFYRTSDLLKIICPCILITGLTEIIKNQILIPRGMDKPYLISIFIGAGVNIILNAFMIPFIGATGASITTVIAYSLTMIIQIIMTKTIINYYKILINLLPFLFIGGIMYVLLQIIGCVSSNIFISLVVKVFAGGSFYIVLSFIFLMLQKKFNQNININL